MSNYNRQRLDDLFGEARTSPPVMSREDVRLLLDDGVTGTTRGEERSHSPGRKGTMTAIMILVALVGIGGTTLMLKGPDKSDPPRAAAAANLNAGSSNGSDDATMPISPPAMILPVAPASGPVLHSTRRGGARASEVAIREPRPSAVEISFARASMIPSRVERIPLSPALAPVTLRKGGFSPLRRDGDRTVDISGIRLIELTREELARLGLQPDTAGVWVFQEKKSGSQSVAVTSTFHVAVPKQPLEQKSFAIQVGKWGTIIPPSADEVKASTTSLPSFFPKLVTDDLGRWRMYVSGDEKINEDLRKRKAAAANGDRAEIERTDRQIRESLRTLHESSIRELAHTNGLVPILVRTGYHYTEADKRDNRWRPDCILWYEATPEFLAALPEHIRRQLEPQIRVAEEIAKKPEAEPLSSFIERMPYEVRRTFDSLRTAIDGEATVESSPSVPGVATLDAWRTASGGISSTALVPNPTRGRARFSYRLDAPRSLTIALHDINGRRLRTLVPEKSRRAGEWEESLDLEGVAAGIYLVSIRTESGEQAVQRLIVEK